MFGILPSPRRGTGTCALLAGVWIGVVGTLLAPVPVQAETTIGGAFADTALVTNWSLPVGRAMVGPLPEPAFVAEGAAPGAGQSVVAPSAHLRTPPDAQTPSIEDTTTVRVVASYERQRLVRTPPDIKRLEIAFHVLNAMDAGMTVACMRRDDCHEQNPVFGKRPRTAVILGAKALTSSVHYWVMRSLLPDHPGVARAFGWFAVTVQGGVVGFNTTQLF